MSVVERESSQRRWDPKKLFICHESVLERKIESTRKSFSLSIRHTLCSPLNNFNILEFSCVKCGFFNTLRINHYSIAAYQLQRQPIAHSPLFQLLTPPLQLSCFRLRMWLRHAAQRTRRTILNRPKGSTYRVKRYLDGSLP